MVQSFSVFMHDDDDMLSIERCFFVTICRFLLHVVWKGRIICQWEMNCKMNLLIRNPNIVHQNPTKYYIQFLVATLILLELLSFSARFLPFKKLKFCYWLHFIGNLSSFMDQKIKFICYKMKVKNLEKVAKWFCQTHEISTILLFIKINFADHWKL